MLNLLNEANGYGNYPFPWIPLLIFGLFFVAIIVLAIVISIRFMRTKVKINPQNRVETDAQVQWCRYQGSMKVGWTQRPVYGVQVNVQGVDRPMRARYALPDESAFFGGMRSMGRMFGGPTPFQPGQTIRIEYDNTKPRRCNILSQPNDMNAQMNNMNQNMGGHGGQIGGNQFPPNQQFGNQPPQMNFDPRTGQPINPQNQQQTSPQPNQQGQQFDKWGNPVATGTTFDDWGNPIPPQGTPPQPPKFGKW